MRVFIDAKLLDIEATVERATASIARTGAEFLTVHAVTGRRSTPRCAAGATAASSFSRHCADQSRAG